MCVVCLSVTFFQHIPYFHGTDIQLNTWHVTRAYIYTKFNHKRKSRSIKQLSSIQTPNITQKQSEPQYKKNHNICVPVIIQYYMKYIVCYPCILYFVLWVGIDVCLIKCMYVCCLSVCHIFFIIFRIFTEQTFN